MKKKSMLLWKAESYILSVLTKKFIVNSESHAQKVVRSAFTVCWRIKTLCAATKKETRFEFLPSQPMWSCHCHAESCINNLSAAAAVMLAQQTVGRRPHLSVPLGKAWEIRELISSSQDCGGEYKCNKPVMLMGADTENWERIRRHPYLRKLFPQSGYL